jgi:hypothetical protein
MRTRRSIVVSEAKLVVSLTSWLAANGYRVKHEVSNMGQSADVVATRGRWVTVFEAKVGNWRKALQQCEAHEPVADFICVAVACGTIKDKLRVEVEKRGYGLVHYTPNQELQWVCKPMRNSRVWLPQRRVWSDVIRRVAYAY